MSGGNIPLANGEYPVTAYFYGRFSQKKQESGTSEERQTDLPRQWCDRKGVPLDETLSYIDRGRSGFHGHHRTRSDAGLYLFLKACHEGRVRKGSYLLVESLDRLSREQLQEGQRLIHALLFDFGVKLVVLFSGQEYTAENYQETHWSLDAEFARAHSESLMKSHRSKDNWQRRRARVKDGGLLTRKVPTWLKVVDGRIVADEDKASTVSLIFHAAAKGRGFASIARMLNDMEVQPFGRGQFWRDSVVEKILKSRAVLGECQPRKLEGGKRVPVGPVLVGYYPAVVSVDEWTAAHAAISSRRTLRGRISKRVSNLFTGLVYDGSGDVMAYTSKRGVGYLQSGRKSSSGIRYDWFERGALYWLRRVKVRLDNTADVGELRVKAEKLERQIKVLRAKIDADEELAELLDTLAAKKRDHAALVREIEGATVPLQSHYLHAQRLAEHLEKVGDAERETVRREFRQQIRLVVGRIDVKVTGAKYRGKRVDVVVVFKDGTRRSFFYESRAGRVVKGHLSVAEGQPIEDVVHNLANAYLFDDKFPVDPEPESELRATCKRLRSEGVPYKEIMKRTGLGRITIWRYATDYVRPDRG